MNKEELNQRIKRVKALVVKLARNARIIAEEDEEITPHEMALVHAVYFSILADSLKLETSALLSAARPFYDDYKQFVADTKKKR